MSRSFIGSGWANQAKTRKQQRYAKQTPKQRAENARKAAAKNQRHQTNFNFLTRK